MKHVMKARYRGGVSIGNGISAAVLSCCARLETRWHFFIFYINRWHKALLSRLERAC